MDLPEDEIYLGLEQTQPCWFLMQTTTDEGTFPMAHLSKTPWNGRVISFLPGHKPEVCANPVLIENIHTLIRYLLDSSA